MASNEFLKILGNDFTKLNQIQINKMQNYEKVKLLRLYCTCRIKKASDFSEA